MQRFQSQVKWGSFPLNVAQFCFIYISPASDGWIPELSYFPFFFSSVIAQSACPGRIRLDDAVRYENKRGIYRGISGINLSCVWDMAGPYA